MNEKLPKFLKRVNNSILFDDDGEMVFYIPEFYFTKNIAVVIGDLINTIGIFNYVLYDKNGKQKTKLTPINFPSAFLTKPYEVEIKKEVKLTKHSDIEDYRLLKYKKGDIVIDSVKVPQLIANTEDFFRILMAGNLINTIPYDKLHEYPVYSMNINGNKFGINNQLFGIVFSELCRNIDDKTIPFRVSGSTDMHAYRCISLKDIPNNISAYSAITSENFDDSVVAATLNKKHKYSPLEKIMTI